MSDENKNEETGGKSIVDAKYREQMQKREPDWIAKMIADNATATKKKVYKETVGEGDKAKEVEKTKTVPDGVDVDALFAIAEGNNLDVAKYRDAERNHGFAGRMRMTVSNMLRAAAKKRHGLYLNGKWQAAPAEWLEAKNAPAEPTEKKDGTKIKKEKPPKEEAAAE